MIFTYQHEKLKNLQKIQFKPDQKRALFFAKKQHVDIVFNTARLEGNPFTMPEVQTLLEGITVGGHKLSDEQQILNQSASYKKLYERIIENKFALNKTNFCELHAIVAREEALSWGVFRDGNVRIAGTQFMPPSAENLNTLFDQVVEHIMHVENVFLQAFLFFLAGSICQFFYDGNKRTSRLITNGILLMNGYPILNICAKDKLAFNTHMIAFYDTQEGTQLLDFLMAYYWKQNSNIGFD